MKVNYLTWAAQHCGRERATLWLLAPRWFSNESVEFCFILVFLLWKPRSHYIMKEAEEINREPSFILQKLVFHKIKDSRMPFKILHILSKYMGLSFLAQNAVHDWVLLY